MPDDEALLFRKASARARRPRGSATNKPEGLPVAASAWPPRCRMCSALSKRPICCLQYRRLCFESPANAALFDCETDPNAAACGLPADSELGHDFLVEIVVFGTTEFLYS